MCKNIQQTDEAFRRYIQESRVQVYSSSQYYYYIESEIRCCVREMRLILFEKKKTKYICRRVFEIIQPCQHVKVEDYIIVSL